MGIGFAEGIITALICVVDSFSALLSQIYSYVSRWGLIWYILTIFRVLRGFESAFRRTACFRRELLGSVWPLLSMDHLI